MRASLLDHPGATGGPAVARALEASGWDVLRFAPDQPLPPAELVVLPDGFAPPGMEILPRSLAKGLRGHLETGGHGLGLGLGFRQLCALGLLPGRWEARDMGFLHRLVTLRVEHTGLGFTRGLGADRVGPWPMATAFRGPILEAEERLDLQLEGRVAFRLEDPLPGEPDLDLMGLCAWEGRLLGLSALPERVPEGLEAILSGLGISKS